MSVNYKIIQAKDFIKAKPTGEIDLKESKKVLGQIADLVEAVGDYEVLIDVREAYGNLDQADLCELVLEFGRHRDAFRSKIAVITRDDEQFNKAVFVEMCANIDGFAISAFTDFEAAIDWLQAEGGLEGLWE
jgi:proline racemase